jgi:hypothetical protein
LTRKAEEEANKAELAKEKAEQIAQQQAQTHNVMVQEPLPPTEPTFSTSPQNDLSSVAMHQMPAPMGQLQAPQMHMQNFMPDPTQPSVEAQAAQAAAQTATV